ncbi:hypothetical protein A2U01_0116839, partial [Trifolium medium]|nr:hypothetical protein [Trifolium medium]
MKGEEEILPEGNSMVEGERSRMKVEAVV